MPGRSARPLAGHRDHAVQFYSDDDELSASVGTFLGQGLAGGGSAVVVVATPAHRAAFAAALLAGAGDGGPAQMAGRLLLVDAAGMLGGFLAGDELDSARFRAAAADLIGRAAAAGQPVRIYAEMVALLWDAGQVTLALELEVLWNDLAAQLPFSLLCAYPARLVTRPDDGGALEQVCRLHTGVLGPYPAAPVAGGALPDEAEAVRGFPADLGSATEARRFVLGLLESRAGQAAAVDAAIVTAELAANAVLHARSDFTVAVSYPAEAVRISVRDAARVDESRPLVTIPGRGLDVVAKIAARWAVEPLPDGKVIWAELDASGQGG
jgi:hypothetical protein